MNKKEHQNSVPPEGHGPVVPPGHGPFFVNGLSVFEL
jgi:hypothetical protein